MTRALIAVGALLALAFAVLGLVVYLTREEDGVAPDGLLALELTRAIGVADQERGEIDLARVADGSWDRVIVATPGTSREALGEALGAPYAGDLTYGRVGQLFVFADGPRLVRYADYRGRATFNGFERPLDVIPRADAVLRVRDGVVEPG